MYVWWLACKNFVRQCCIWLHTLRPTPWHPWLVSSKLSIRATAAGSVCLLEPILDSAVFNQEGTTLAASAVHLTWNSGTGASGPQCYVWKSKTEKVLLLEFSLSCVVLDNRQTLIVEGLHPWLDSLVIVIFPAWGLASLCYPLFHDLLWTFKV